MKKPVSMRLRSEITRASIYIASILCNERRSQREVAGVAGATEVTIMNRYKELPEKLGIRVTLWLAGQETS